MRYALAFCLVLQVSCTGESSSEKPKPGEGKINMDKLPGEQATGGITVTPSGLKYYDLKAGTGARPAGPTSKVTVHYTGWFPDGTEFDSSVRRNKPAEFALNGVIKGWTEGVGTMSVGGKRKLIVPPDLGYGPNGRGKIPGNATLVFDVELLGVQD